jgi:hypothetical protein
MKGDAISCRNTARRHSARETLGVASNPFVSPGFFVKDECRGFWLRLNLVHQSTHWGRFHWLVSRCRYAIENWTGRATELFQPWENGCDRKRANKHMAKTRRTIAFAACDVFR